MPESACWKGNQSIRGFSGRQDCICCWAWCLHMSTYICDFICVTQSLIYHDISLHILTIYTQYPYCIFNSPCSFVHTCCQTRQCDALGNRYSNSSRHKAHPYLSLLIFFVYHCFIHWWFQLHCAMQIRDGSETTPQCDRVEASHWLTFESQELQSQTNEGCGAIDRSPSCLVEYVQMWPAVH